MDLSTMSCCIICVFALLINKVSLQDVNFFVGFTGGSVVLPCATSDVELKLSDINVFWRHNDNLPVCDIIKGKFSLQDQHFNYTNRVESFPTEYEKGNFSIKLNNLKHADAGDYQCYILPSNERAITQLIITESTVQTGGQPTAENKNPARETRIWIILTPVLGVLICLVICITWKKRCKEHSSPDGPPPVKYIACHNKTEVNGNGNESKSAKEQSQK